MEDSEYYRIDQVEEEHFWYRAMESAVLDTMDRYFSEGNLQILDLGCGPGGMTQKLAKFGTVTGVDIHPLALRLAKRRVDRIIQADVCNLPLPGSIYDLVTISDVLYNLAVQDDVQAMAEVFRLLVSGGLLYLREPALEQMRGDHDIVVKTRQRYTVQEIKQKLEQVGFIIQKISYANMLLGIPIYFRRLLQRIGTSEQAASDTAPLPALVNRFFYAILYHENKLGDRINLPFGTSVVCLARKPE